MTRFAATHDGRVLGVFLTFGDARDHLVAVHPHARHARDGVCSHGFTVKVVKV